MSSLKYTPLHEITAIHTTLKKEYRTGKTKSIAFRKQQLIQLFYLIDDNRKLFCDALLADLGRSSAESYMLEISCSLTEIRHAYDNVEKWVKPEGVPITMNYFLANPTIRKESKGLVAVIVPFNYPVLLSIWSVTAALAAGNAVVLKPSELVPNVSALFEELFAKYMDPSLYRVVNGAVDEVTHMLTLPWDHISYTGSGRVGRIIATAAAKHLTPVTLELGGKSPVFVDPNCDMVSAVNRILSGKFMNTGQTCVAPDYVLIPKQALDKFIATLKLSYAEFYPDGPAKSALFARIVNDGHFRRLKSLLDKSNGTIVLGGESDASKKYIAPTVVKDVQPDDSLMSEELFGPILPIIAVKDLDEALDVVNSGDHPLTIYVFSQDSAFKEKVADNTHSGSIVNNDTMMHAIVPGLPFGGVGPSGYGGYVTGIHGFNSFTHLRGTMDNPRWLEFLLKFRFPPLTNGKAKLIDTLLFPRPLPRSSLKLSTRWGKWFSVAIVIGVSAYLTNRKAIPR